ncbi:MAG TPA: DUF4142 domain-containing protein [Terriglobia bacterium]|nr:DUF4142 domain-containing protein [Terriglobia bacterium]
MPNSVFIKAGSLLASVFVAGGIAFAQPPEPQGALPGAATGRMMNKMSDQAFVKKTSEASLAQVKFARLAEQKGSTQAIRDNGRQMVEAHAQFQQKLQDAASQANLDLLRNKMSGMEQRGYNRLSKLSGPAFDQAYARAVVKGHQAAVAAFREEAQNGKKQPVKQFAQNELPNLLSQLSKAREMSSNVQSASAQTQGGDSSGSPSSR